MNPFLKDKCEICGYFKNDFGECECPKDEGIELLKFYREQEQATAEKLLIETKFIRKEINALRAQRDYHALVYAEEAKKSKVKRYLIACEHVEILNKLINQFGGK